MRLRTASLSLALLIGSWPWPRAHAASITADATWASRYVSDGFAIGGDHPVLQPSLRMETPLTGLSVMLWSSFQTDRTRQQHDELDLITRYERDLFANSPFRLNLHGFVAYWVYPKLQDQMTHMRGNKLHAGISAPDLLPLGSTHLVPAYNVYYWLYWAGNDRDQFQGGARHELLLQTDFAISPFLPGVQAHYIGMLGTLNYNDGAFGVRPAWTHSTAQLGTSLHAAGLVFSLSLNRQWSYEPSVNPDNVLWSSLSVTRRF